MPVALNCWVVPNAIDVLGGLIASDTRPAGVTVSIIEPLMVPEVAVIVALPVATAVASPWLPATLLMVATVISEELQGAVVVKS